MIIYLVPNIIFVQYIHVSPCLVYYIHVSPCLVYYSLLKSIDLTNLEKAFKYLVTSSLLVVPCASKHVNVSSVVFYCVKL
jgi:hypothetical protein